MRGQLLTTLLLIGAAAIASAETIPSAQEKCLAAKIHATGSYFRCAQDAAAREFLGHRRDLQRCERRLATSVQRAEERSGFACTDGHDAGALEAELSTASVRILRVLGIAPFGGCAGSWDQTVATVSLDQSITSARVDILYPRAVSVPGIRNDLSVKERVAFVRGGLTAVNDEDIDQDGTDETLVLAQVSTDVLPPGAFATVTSDGCAGNEPVPASAFVCRVRSAALEGQIVTPTCNVTVR